MSYLSWTGNPFVDTGLAVMIARAKELGEPVTTISDLTPAIIEKVTKCKLTDSSQEYSWLSVTNRKLNSYTMIFSSNNPLTNASTNIDNVLENLEKKIKYTGKKINEVKQKIQGVTRDLTAKEKSLATEKNSRDRKTIHNSVEKGKRGKITLEKALVKLETQYKDQQKKKDAKEEAIKTKKEKGIDTKQGLKDYIDIMQGLILDIKNTNTTPSMFCEATGIPQITGVLDRKGKNIGKEWFPLAGTLSDVQTLPASSRSMRLSALSLLAVQYLPLGVGIIGKRLVCFQTNDYALNDIPIFQLMVEGIFADTNSKALVMDKVETWGKGSAYSSIPLLLLGHLTALEQRRMLYELPNWICLNLWCFSNSGQEPALEIIEIPNGALQFLWEAWRGNLRDELEKYLRAEEDFESQLLECIKNNEEYFPFYPHSKNNKKVSVYIENLPRDVLSGKLSESISKNISYDRDKHLLSLDRSIDEAELKNLFSLSSNNSYRDSIKKLFAKSQYWLTGSASIELFELYAIKILGYSRTALDVAKWVASELTNKASKEDSGEFDKSLSPKELRTKLALQAEQGLTLEHYLALFPCTVHPLRVDSNKQLSASRIIWFYANQRNLIDQELPMSSNAITQYTHPKYLKIKSFAQDFFDYYIGQQGKERFEKRILATFKRNQITPKEVEDWFALLGEIKEGYTNEEWDDLCRDENGTSEVWEVLFQIRLELTNLYRIKYQTT